MKVNIYAEEDANKQVVFKADNKEYITIETFIPTNSNEKDILVNGMMNVIGFIQANF